MLATLALIGESPASFHYRQTQSSGTGRVTSPGTQVQGGILVPGRTENITEGLDKGVFELLLTFKGFAFQLRAQGLAPALYSFPVIYSIVTNGTAGYLGISNRQASVSVIHSVES